MRELYRTASILALITIGLHPKRGVERALAGASKEKLGYKGGTE